MGRSDYKFAILPSKKYKPHEFDINISNMVLTYEQERIFYKMLENPNGLHVLTGTWYTWVWENIFCKICNAIFSSPKQARTIVCNNRGNNIKVIL